MFVMDLKYQKACFLFLALFCLLPFVDSAMALLIGIGVAFTFGNPYEAQTKKVSSLLLKACVVLLGFGINLFTALKVGASGALVTALTIGVTFAASAFFLHFYKMEKNCSTLITCGTAICGGSAIAAIAPVIRAHNDHISVALGTVFLLNSVALMIFPALGHFFGLTEHQFGLWCAMAIHDTSSVVGAAAKYGKTALEIATTVKLARTLWIIPLALIISFLNKGDRSSIQFPTFILFFVLAMAVGTYTPQFNPLYHWLIILARRGLALTLFCIGTGLSYKNIKQVGMRPLFLGVFLWGVISVVSLIIIKNS